MFGQVMTRQSIQSTARFIGLISLLMFFVSLWLPALLFREQPDGVVQSYWGGALLMLGWIEAIGGSVRGIAWLANPCFAAGTLFLMIGRYGWASVVQGTACFLASASFEIEAVCINEGGTGAAIMGLGPGFWCWYLAMLASCGASLICGILSARCKIHDSELSRAQS
jgi:hypothetical protein